MDVAQWMVTQMLVLVGYRGVVLVVSRYKLVVDRVEVS
jgi:hypothetical protein